jgi:hypothetical protein
MGLRHTLLNRSFLVLCVLTYKILDNRTIQLYILPQSANSLGFLSEKWKKFTIYKHGLINFIDTKAKCRHLKKLTCKGTLRQVFIRVCRLEIQMVMLVFSTHFCKLLPSLWFNSLPLPLSLHCVNKYTAYT